MAVQNSAWPPGVIIAAHQDKIRHAIREMVRNSGVRNIALCSSSNEIFSMLGKEPKYRSVVILDGKLSNAMESAKSISGNYPGSSKVILIFAGPTQKDVEIAIRAGVSDILIYPFSQATVEKKLKKLSGRPDSQDKGAQKREFPRHDVLALVIAPSLSDAPLVPENISGGGLMVVLQTKPELDSIQPCNLQIEGRDLSRIDARVVRVDELDTEPPSWTVGMSFQLEREQREELASLIEEAKLSRQGAASDLKVCC